MASANVLGRNKKVALPSGWVERISKKHPDRPFYFNEETGETRWAPPLEMENKKKSEHKGKKRKNMDRDSDDFSDASPSAAEMLLNSIIDRPKLKARGVKVASSLTQGPNNNDTPAMRMVREKLAQRKAAAEMKKNTIKSVIQKHNQALIAASEIISQIPDSSTTAMPRRSTRGSSVASSTESVSDCSIISSVSSMGAKIKATASAASTPKISDKDDKTVKQITMNRLPQIPKVCIAKNSTSFKTNLTSNEKSLDCKTGKKSPRDDANTSSIRSPLKRNAANERLESFRKNLRTESCKKSSAQRLNGSQLIDNSCLSESALNKNKLNFSTPILRQEPYHRLFSLETRIENDGVLNINSLKTDKEENIDNKEVLEKIEISDLYCEEMEWEPIEDEKIMSEVYSARYQLCEKNKKTLSKELPCNTIQSVNISGEKNALYIIIDTNVFLSNLPFIEEVRDSYSDIYGRPFIIIPWTVLQELDFIKDDRNNTRSQALKLKARKAVEFLNRHFAAKHPRFLGQTPSDVKTNKEKFEIECPDDEILQTCLQVKEFSKSPVLLSYDKNLCTKAMIHDIPILGRNDPLEKIYYLKAAESTQFLSNSLHAHTEENQDESIIQRELLVADDIMEEGKAVLKSALSQVVAKEMENLFGNKWEKHVIIHPPWTAVTVLKCAVKHWIAAVSESFTRKTEPMLRDLQLCITNVPEGGRKLQDVKFFLDKCNDVIQTLDATKYPIFKDKILSQINKLKERCSNLIDELNNARFQESVGSMEAENENENSAVLAFKVFEDVYAFARDTCGIASDVLGLQCAFAYNKFHPFLSSKLALQQQQDIGINVNRLLQILRISLSKDAENIRPNDKIILSLYEALINFSPNLNFDELSKLRPIDLFCCIKLKKSKLEKGYEQLQELAVHFCRIANFQCT